MQTTFSFADPPYNTTGINESSISASSVWVTYKIAEVTTSDRTRTGLYCPAFLCGGQTREYVTSYLINNTDYFNLSTRFAAQTCFLCGLNWEVCDSFTYANTASGERAAYNFTCETNFIGGSPNTISHRLRAFSAHGPGATHFNGTNFAEPRCCTEVWANWRSDETTDHELDLYSTAITSNVYATLQAHTLTNYTLAYSLTAKNVAEDIGTTSLSYYFVTYANHNATYTAVSAAEAAQCKPILFGIIPCGSISSIFNWVFSGIHTVLSAVFGLFPYGQETADFVTQLLGFVIGIPLYLASLFLTYPLKFLIFHSWFFAMIGIVRYASSPSAEIGTIFATPWLIWKFIANAIIQVAAFLYRIGAQIIQAIIGIIP